MDEQAAALLQTLNNAISQGVQNMPEMAKLAIMEYGRYHGAKIFAEIPQLLFGFIGLLFAYMLLRQGAKTEGKNSDVLLVLGVFFSLIFPTIILISIGFIADNFSTWVSPLGAIVSKALQ